MTTAPEVGYSEYLTVAETAKLVRKALAKAFPGYIFTVRSNSYAGGASIDVGWRDGPPAKVVDSVVHGFAGGRFDGMIDMAYSVESWLEPDGTAYVAGNPGTQDSMGMDPGFVDDPRSPDARLVHFGADYVFTNRRLTPEAEAVIDRKFCEKYGEATDLEDYTRNMWRREIEQRWLFAPCQFAYTVRHGFGDNSETVAEGLTKAEAGKLIKALTKSDRRKYRWLYCDAHRAEGVCR